MAHDPRVADLEREIRTLETDIENLLEVVALLNNRVVKLEKGKRDGQRS